MNRSHKTYARLKSAKDQHHRSVLCYLILSVGAHPYLSPHFRNIVFNKIYIAEVRMKKISELLLRTFRNGLSRFRNSQTVIFSLTKFQCMCQCFHVHDRAHDHVRQNCSGYATAKLGKSLSRHRSWNTSNAAIPS